MIRPSIALAAKLTGNPVPQLAFTFSDITERLNAVQNGIAQELHFASEWPYTAPFQRFDMLNVFCITMALMVGTAGLPHIIVRFYTVPNVRAARYSAGWALLFIAILYTSAPALAAFARYNLLENLHGKTLEQVRELSWVQSWEKTGLLGFEDKNGDDILQLSKNADQNEIQIDRDIIVLSTPEVAGLSAWVVGLVAAGGLAAALSTAAGLLLVISSSIAHDLYAKLINPAATEAQRLLVGRIMIFVAICVAGYFGINPPGFVAEVVAFAFGFAAASFFPVILLGIFDSRTNRAGAILGMVVGLGFTAFYIVGNRFFGMPAWCFGIGAQGIGTVGMVLNLVVTFTVSRMTAPPPDHIRQMVEDVRNPRGIGAAATH